MLWQTCRKPPPVSDSPVFSGSEATVSHSGRLRDPEPSLPPSLPSFQVFSPHWQISGRESWILWRWCFGEHFNFVNLLSWSTWDEILTNQTAVSELRQMSTNERLDILSSQFPCHRETKKCDLSDVYDVIRQGNEMISLPQLLGSSSHCCITEDRGKSSQLAELTVASSAGKRCSAVTTESSEQSPPPGGSLCSPECRTWWPISSPGTWTFSSRVFSSGKRWEMSDQAGPLSLSLQTGHGQFKAVSVRVRGVERFHWRESLGLWPASTKHHQVQ